MANSKKSDEDPKQAAGPAGVPSVLSAAAGRDAPVPASLLPSYGDARALVQAPYSCLVLDTNRRHVVLPPMFMKKKKTGIQEELNSELLKYSTSLTGVPLAYDHIKIIGQQGDIYDDQGFIHLNIEASFVVFKPKKGDKLVGVINKLAVGHVGCLVHGCFNACVMKPLHLTPEQWRDSGMKVGEQLEFEVFQLDADVAGVLLIRGRLEKSRVHELLASVNKTETEEQNNTAEPDSATVNEDTEITDTSKPKNKKKKKNRVTDSEITEENGSQAAETETYDVNSNGINADPDSDSPSKEKEKKKKKKKKDKRHEADEELPSPTELRNSDSSGYLSDKASRKRKTQDEDSSMPAEKKKKKMIK